MPRMPRFWPDPQRTRSRAAECPGIAVGDLLPADKPPIQLLQLALTESALEVGDAAVVSEVAHLIGPPAALAALAMVGGDAVISEAAHARIQLGAVGRDHAPFAGGDVLDRVKTEHRQIRQRSHGLAFVGG